MAEIIYTYNKQVYANITNKCDCACTFCIRNQKDGVGEAENLWHTKNPTFDDIKEAIDNFDFSLYEEFVFCGYGEPTCELELLLKTAEYIKNNHNMLIRLNTNGLGNLYNKKNIVPELAKVIDKISISLNAPNKDDYDKVSRPQFENAYEGLLEFAKECKNYIDNTCLSVVDVLSKEDIDECQRIADKLGIELRVRKYES